ncbi:MAG: alpha/beta hydrolase [Nitrospiria bacterium]
MPGADSKRAPFLFSFPHKTSIGLLLIHGLTASPWEVMEVGKRAYEKGFTVYGVRLAGHGTTLEDLDQRTFQDWVQSGFEGIDLIRYFSDKIVVCGLSLGGLVALSLAEDQKCEVVISLSAPLHLKTSLKLFILIFKNFKRYQFRPLRGGLEDYYYSRHSFHALQEMTCLGRIVEANLYKIDQPLLVMQSEMDIRVHPKSGFMIIEKVQSKIKEMVSFGKEEQVPHVMTTLENPLIEKVLEKIMEFLLRTSAK